MNERLDPTSAFRLDNRVVILTGASSGLGARFARVIDGLGGSVVLAARRIDRIAPLAESLQSALAVQCDVGELGANEELVARAIERFGRLDGVVANAGIANTLPAAKETTADFSHLVAIDLVAPFDLARTALPHLRATNGSIVMVASAAGHGSTPMLPQAGYVAAKTGLVGLTRELAMQWARYNVRVNALCPGMFPSEMTSALTDDPSRRGLFEAQIPLQRVGREHELDGALTFLLSDASSYMTGQSVIVDGGMGTH
jgi:NAD(P)-dependent dehydrogenase (short-subunit alcohol dehydrogenase family)